MSPKSHTRHHQTPHQAPPQVHGLQGHFQSHFLSQTTLRTTFPKHSFKELTFSPLWVISAQDPSHLHLLHSQHSTNDLHRADDTVCLGHSLYALEQKKAKTTLENLFSWGENKTIISHELSSQPQLSPEGCDAECAPKEPGTNFLHPSSSPHLQTRQLAPEPSTFFFFWTRFKQK